MTIWYLRSLHTIEHKIAVTNAVADDVQKFVLDGRRGVGKTSSGYRLPSGIKTYFEKV